MAGGKKIGSVWRGEILASIVLFGVSLAAHADCDDVVKSLRTRHLGAVTLCEVQSRYRAAAEKLRPRGITDATHLGNVYALRFIDKKAGPNISTRTAIRPMPLGPSTLPATRLGAIGPGRRFTSTTPT